jgi:ABC-type branched-subunit amino acid transport system permease subunit
LAGSIIQHDRYALEAIAEDEDAAGAAGVNVTAEKLKITLLSAAMTAFAGALYCQYQMFISPDTVSGISVSLQMVFAAVVGGLYVLPGPTVGAIITILLAEICASASAPAPWAGTISSTARCWCCSSSSCRKGWPARHGTN